MKPPRGDADFERWLEQGLRRTVASVRGPSPRAEQAAYRAAARRRGGPAAARPALLGRGAVGLLAVALTLGAAGAVAVGAGSQVPEELARSVAQIVHGCPVGEAAGGQAASAARDGAGGCAAAQLDQSGARRRPAGAGQDGGAGPAAAPPTHDGHGQEGGGSAAAPGQGGQGRAGGNGQGNGQGGRPSPEPSDHGHRASGGTGAPG